MTYQISATKLQAYHRCAYAYYLRYERKLSSTDFYGSAALGNALHQALARCHRDWHYHTPLPDLSWIYDCWDEHSHGLSDRQVTEGRDILERYYWRFIASQRSLAQPLAVEGKIQGYLQVEDLGFNLVGRYDRIDFLSDGLELIDYKSGREVKLPDPSEINIQIGLYYLALEQTYRQSLKYLSLLFLRSGEKVQFTATPEHKAQVQQIIGDLAVRLRHDRGWEPKPSHHCDRCTFARYCPAMTAHPAEVPTPKTESQLQLVLNFA